MEAMDLFDVAAAVGANPAGIGNGAVRSVCTDSRLVEPGALFFALRGENSDAHGYVSQAFERGCAAAVVERVVQDVAGPQLVVPDPLRALGSLANAYRLQFDLPVIAVTGSVGKTSTRALIAHVLRSRLNVLESEKNFNNEIGVPLTLFRLERTHQAAVIEMGMRGAGQIADLCEIAHPTIGIITNIGLSHIELLGSRENIARAKGELLRSLPGDGTALLPADDDYINLLRELAGNRRVRTFGVRREADFHATAISFESDGSCCFTVNDDPFRLRTPGVHHIVNACAAAAVAVQLGLTLAEAAAQVETFRAPAMRMEIAELAQGITLINDAYNAAPDSMRSALETLSLLAGSRRSVAILGDMRELGEWSDEGHRAVGQMAASNGIDLIISVGEAARLIADAAAEGCGSTVVSFPNTSMAAREVSPLLRPGDTVLVKGSRAMEMEQVVQAISTRFGNSGPADQPTE